MDYLSDSVVNENVVTVGAGSAYDYATIQEALDANESSAAEPLVLLIAPGTYTEHVTVDKPWVSFQPMYRDGGEIVIEESYYSSNTFDENGTFIPQDEYDVGTDQSGTVLLTANAAAGVNKAAKTGDTWNPAVWAAAILLSAAGAAYGAVRKKTHR